MAKFCKFSKIMQYNEYAPIVINDKPIEIVTTNKLLRKCNCFQSKHFKNQARYEKSVTRFYR